MLHFKWISVVIVEVLQVFFEKALYTVIIGYHMLLCFICECLMKKMYVSISLMFQQEKYGGYFSANCNLRCNFYNITVSIQILPGNTCTQ